MKVYSSTKSFGVKLIVGLLLTVALLLLLLVKYISGWLPITFISLTIVTLISVMIYCYSMSLSKIIVGDSTIVLRKIRGQQTIDASNITKVKKIKYAKLLAPKSTNGICGYNGVLDDGTTTLVNNKRKMVKIRTHDAKYFVSCDQPEMLITEIKNIANL